MIKLPRGRGAPLAELPVPARSAILEVVGVLLNFVLWGAGPALCFYGVVQWLVSTLVQERFWGLDVTAPRRFLIPAGALAMAMLAMIFTLLGGVIGGRLAAWVGVGKSRRNHLLRELFRNQRVQIEEALGPEEQPIALIAVDEVEKRGEFPLVGALWVIAVITLLLMVLSTLSSEVFWDAAAGPWLGLLILAWPFALGWALLPMVPWHDHALFAIFGLPLLCGVGSLLILPGLAWFSLTRGLLPALLLVHLLLAGRARRHRERPQALLLTTAGLRRIGDRQLIPRFARRPASLTLEPASHAAAWNLVYEDGTGERVFPAGLSRGEATSLLAEAGLVSEVDGNDTWEGWFWAFLKPVPRLLPVCAAATAMWGTLVVPLVVFGFEEQRNSAVVRYRRDSQIHVPLVEKHDAWLMGQYPRIAGYQIEHGRWLCRWERWEAAKAARSALEALESWVPYSIPLEETWDYALRRQFLEPLARWERLTRAAPGQGWEPTGEALGPFRAGMLYVFPYDFPPTRRAEATAASSLVEALEKDPSSPGPPMMLALLVLQDGPRVVDPLRLGDSDGGIRARAEPRVRELRKRAHGNLEHWRSDPAWGGLAAELQTRLAGDAGTLSQAFWDALYAKAIEPPTQGEEILELFSRHK